MLLSASQKRSAFLVGRDKCAFLRNATIPPIHGFETSVKDYHDRNRVRESYSSIACEMGTGRTDKLVITVSTKRFEIWHTEVK